MLATRSLDKIHELRDLFRRYGRTLIDIGELGIPASPEEGDLENAETFEGNALAKARFFCRLLGGVSVMADDSGLEVAGLGGRPGVRSKRWSGRADLEGKDLDIANNALLVGELEGVHDRRARYVCAAAFCEGGRELVTRGTTEGEILLEARGSHGFGYDPYFFSNELGKTFGEATLEEKQRVSHRARAFRALVEAIDGRG